MTNPRFTGENFQRNLAIADEVAGGRRRGRRHAGAGRPGLAAGEGRRHRPDSRHQAGARLEENIAADAVELTAEQIEELNDLTPAAGEHHNEQQMRDDRSLTVEKRAPYW